MSVLPLVSVLPPVSVLPLVLVVPLVLVLCTRGSKNFEEIFLSHSCFGFFANDLHFNVAWLNCEH